MLQRLNLIVAASENMGIGINGELPWKLRKEMAYFSKMTKQTKDISKQNAVIMGRRTWQSIPEKNRPLPGRVNVVLTGQNLNLGDNVHVCNSLESALKELDTTPLKDTVEDIWVIGGSSVYKEAMASPHCHRIYLTKVLKNFECDTFLPDIPSSLFRQIKDTDVPEDIQEDNGIRYEYQVYERISDASSL